MRCYALGGIGNPKAVGDNTARFLVHSPAPLVATRTYVGIGLRRWLYDACLRLFWSVSTYPVAIVIAAFLRRRIQLLVLLPCVNVVAFLISGW
jgi:hypothetical protein